MADDTPKHVVPNADALPMILGGSAKLTFLRTDTGSRISFWVKKLKPNPKYPQTAYSVRYRFNEDTTDGKGWAYLGLIFEDTLSYWASRKRIAASPCRQALEHGSNVFAWIWRHMTTQTMPDVIQTWLAGSCCCCGKELRVSLSIERAMGPRCWGRFSEHRITLQQLVLQHLEAQRQRAARQTAQTSTN